MTKHSLAILCAISVLVRCASVSNRKQLDGWSGGSAAVGSYSGVALNSSNQDISGAALIANALVVFHCGDSTCAAPTSTRLAIDHQGISNYGFVGGNLAKSESLLVFSERGRDGLRKVLCRDASCSTIVEERLSNFRYHTWRLSDGDDPKLVAGVKSSTDELDDLVSFECSPHRCDDEVAQIVARSIRVGHLGVAAGANELWLANAVRDSTALDVYYCSGGDCTQVLVPDLGTGVATSVDAAYVDGTAWFAVTGRGDVEKKSTLRLVVCRGGACRTVHDLLDEASAEHVRVTAGSSGLIVAYTNTRDGRLRLAQCSEAECSKTVVDAQGIPYAVALKTDTVVVAYSDTGNPRLALCKDNKCVTREIGSPSLLSDAAAAH